MEINREGIESFLPHRDPFLFLDSIDLIEVPHREGSISNGELMIREMEGVKITASFFASESMEIFKGHFPGNPVLPGVIQIEMMAQAACFGLRKIVSDEDLSKKIEVALAKVEEAKFRRPIRPNEKLTMMATCLKARGNTVLYQCELFSGGEKCSEARIWATHNIKKEK